MIADCNYEAGRENPVSARGGRGVARLGPRNDAAGSGAGVEARVAAIHQPVVSVANRERGAPASDQFHAHAAGAVFQSASRLPGGRSGRLSHRAGFRCSHARGPAGFVADRGRRAVPARSGGRAGVIERGQACRFAEMSAVTGSDSGNAGIAGSIIRSADAGERGSSQEASGMSWETFYFGCFLIGFLFSLLSVLSGSHHLHLHLPRGWHAPAARGGSIIKGSQDSPFNFGTIAAFLAWFGGTGYLLTRYSSVWALLALALALLSGLGGAAAVFWFLFKVLLRHERDLDAADYDMIGVLGRVSSPVREGGTGEMIF